MIATGNACKTVGSLARELSVPEWKVRRVADSVAKGVERIGLYRVIDADAELAIRDELTRQGWLPVRGESV